MIRALALAALLALAACGSAPDRLLDACRAYTGTLTALAGYRAEGRLSAEQIATVNRWRPVLNSACDGDSAVDLAATIDGVEAALMKLIAVERKAAQ